MAKVISKKAKSNGVKLPVRFQLPSDKELVSLAILMRDGDDSDLERLNDMFSMCRFVVHRLYENGNIFEPAKEEGN